LTARARLAGSVLIVLSLAGCGCPSPAPVTAPADVDGLAELLAANALDAVVFDAGSLLLKRDWIQVLVFVEDGGASLQGVFPHTGRQAPLDPSLVARWNATRRFGRAYEDEDGRPVLASDLLLVGGVGPDAVVGWCRLMLDMAATFAAEVWPVPVPVPQSDPANE